MTSNRSYRQGLAHEIAVEEIKRCAGTQFDPEVVKAFMKVENLFKEAVDDPVGYYAEYSVINRLYQNDSNLQ